MLSWQELRKWLLEIAAPALCLTIMLCGLKRNPKLGSTPELERVLGYEGLDNFSVIIGVTTSRVERETLLMENIASDTVIRPQSAF